jgi:hypothetical protein
MLSPQDIDWTIVEGVSYDVPTILTELENLISGKLSEDEQTELMVEFVREWRATTAGYAAIPILLGEKTPGGQTAWRMALTACQIIGLSDQEGNPPVPPSLLPNVNTETRRFALRRLFETMSETDLSAADLLWSAAASLGASGRSDLSESIVEMALRESNSDI